MRKKYFLPLFFLLISMAAQNAMAYHSKPLYPPGTPDQYWHYDDQKYLIETFNGHQRFLHVVYNGYYKCYCTMPEKNKLYIFGDGIDEIVWSRCFIGKSFSAKDSRGRHVIGRWNTYFDRPMEDEGFWSPMVPVVPDDPALLPQLTKQWYTPLKNEDRYRP